MRAKSLRGQRRRCRNKSIAAVVACVALMLTAGSQRASAVEQSGQSWDMCQNQPFLEGD